MPTILEDPRFWSVSVLVGHWSLVFLFSLRVIYSRLSIGSSLAWLTVMFAVPFFGVGLYFFIGGKKLNKKRLSKYKRSDEMSQKFILDLADSPFYAKPGENYVSAGLHRQVVGLFNSLPLKGDKVQLISCSDDFFNALVESIEFAREQCSLEFYICEAGGRVDLVFNALKRACNRGVKCRFLVDAVGSKEFLGSKSVNMLRNAGIEIASALQPTISQRADLRNHRKLVVIDNSIAFTGSHNLADPHGFKKELKIGEWVDAVVKVEGPSVPVLANIFEIDWALETENEYVSPLLNGNNLPKEPVGNQILQVLPSGPAPNPDSIRKILLKFIYTAEINLTLTTPYFVPDEAIHTALLSACSRGVVVTIIVPAKNDSFLVRHASSAYFDDLLKAGARIALFKTGLLHTKSIVIDDQFSFFGSVNLDMRSFWLNFELSLFIDDLEFAKNLTNLQSNYIEQSDLIDIHVWEKRSKIRQFLENGIRLIGPLL